MSVKLSTVAGLVEGGCAYELMGLRREPDHVFVSLGYKLRTGVPAQYVFAVPMIDLGNGAAGAIAAHLEIATADIKMGEQSASPGLVWG